MKKALALFFVFAMAMSLSVVSVAAVKKVDKGSIKDTVEHSITKVKRVTQQEKEEVKEKVNKTVTKSKDTVKEAKEDSAKLQEIKKGFKTELNAVKKELQQEKASLEQEKEALQTQYQTYIDAGDQEAAKAVLEKIKALDEDTNTLKAKIKQTINERHMVVKTMYSETELAQFDEASELIEKMYEDAKTLQAGAITVNNALIKFDAPPYIKGGVTLVPVRAITEGLGAEVSWDAESQTATISKNDTEIEITVNSTKVLVNGEEVDITLPSNINSGRVYVPLRFIAETLDLNVSWDGDNQIIDIDNDTANDTDADTDATDADTETDADTDATDADTETDADTDATDADAETDADTNDTDAGTETDADTNDTTDPDTDSDNTNTESEVDPSGTDSDETTN